MGCKTVRLSFQFYQETEIREVDGDHRQKRKIRGERVAGDDNQDGGNYAEQRQHYRYPDGP